MADPQRIDQIVAAIAALSAAEQRQLLRRLRVSGLLPSEELMVDRNRLATAPAVRKGAASVTGPERDLQQREAAQPKATAPRDGAAPLPLRMAGHATPDGSRTPAGKVVLGAPSPANAAPEPHGMAPLPGQAPERPIVIILIYSPKMPSDFIAKALFKLPPAFRVTIVLCGAVMIHLTIGTYHTFGKI